MYGFALSSCHLQQCYRLFGEMLYECADVAVHSARADVDSMNRPYGASNPQDSLTGHSSTSSCNRELAIYTSGLSGLAVRPCVSMYVHTYSHMCANTNADTVTPASRTCHTAACCRTSQSVTVPSSVPVSTMRPHRSASRKTTAESWSVSSRSARPRQPCPVHGWRPSPRRHSLTEQSQAPAGGPRSAGGQAQRRRRQHHGRCAEMCALTIASSMLLSRILAVSLLHSLDRCP